MADATLFNQQEDSMSAEQAVVLQDERQVVVQTDAATLMSVISRAASDPHMDVDKLTRLADLYERITDRSAERAYDEAMNVCQEDMRPIAADANNPQTRSQYASFAQLDRALRPIYTRHGFSLSFGSGEGAPADHIRLVARVAHRDGHKERPYLDMPADGKGAKGGDVMTKTHATGAAVTYGRRYLLAMIFNIAVGDDDDGNSNGGREMGAAAKRAIETLNGHKTIEEHRAWRAQHSAGIEKMVSPAEWREIVALYNRRAKALNSVVPADDVSDFSGDRR